MLVFGKIKTPLGKMSAFVSDEGLSLLEFCDRKRYDRQISGLKRYFKTEIAESEHPLLIQIQNQLNEYFEKKRFVFDIPLNFTGTKFQKSVWETLLEIPYGRTVSYSDVAQKTGKPEAVRAVAGATGANKIAIIVPCHRVIGKNGTLIGYAGGLGRKKYLLDIENRQHKNIKK